MNEIQQTKNNQAQDWLLPSIKNIENSNSIFHRLKKAEDKFVNLRISFLALDILKFFLENKTTYPEPDSEEGDSEDDLEGFM